MMVASIGNVVPNIGQVGSLADTERVEALERELAELRAWVNGLASARWYELRDGGRVKFMLFCDDRADGTTIASDAAGVELEYEDKMPADAVLAYRSRGPELGTASAE